MTMQGGWGVDCPGVRGCNLVHIDLSGVFCHARLHRIVVFRAVLWNRVRPVWGVMIRERLVDWS